MFLDVMKSVQHDVLFLCPTESQIWKSIDSFLKYGHIKSAILDFLEKLTLSKRTPRGRLGIHTLAILVLGQDKLVCKVLAKNKDFTAQDLKE